MRYLKFSLLLILSLNAFAFEDIQCLQNEFETEIQRGLDPFGLFHKKLKVTKSKCEFILEVEKFKYLKEKWIIDVCRTPVHIKKGVKMVDVLKRDGSCDGDSLGNDYCQNTKELITLIQDEGLIFAKGQKENLSTDHGKFYCSYLLFQKYLHKGIVFDRDSKYIEAPKEKVVETPVVEEPVVPETDGFPGKIENVESF